ncbi:uncharacterized protein [Acropora muricata]|uniref:uncharacterized protein isoform X2 n=1 Tax=Acropora muricata TaxID=159855 RepID=UPI0034E4D534
MVHDDKGTLAWFYSDRRELLFGIERVRGLLLSTERYKFCSIGMALILRFAVFALLLLPYQCEAKTEGCSETQCLLLPDGDDLVASKFHFKASEKGVRLVYINLVIGNASYDPLELPDVFLPHRWVWANTIHEPMLSLPDDYDILSLGLLNYQVRSIDVKLKDQPSGCLAKLNSTCKNLAVGRMLLENVTSSISGDTLRKKTPVVCVAWINRKDRTETVRYQCCDVHKEVTEPAATLRCNQSVDEDYVFSLKDEIEKENRLAVQTDRETTGDELIPATEGEQYNQTESGADRENADAVALHSLTISNTSIAAAAANTNTTTDNTNREETGQNTSNSGTKSRERGEEGEFFPVDDSSPMNVSTLLRESVQKLPDIPKSFNIKLAFIFFFVFPCVCYLQMVLYLTLKGIHLNECRNKQVAFKQVTVFSRVTFMTSIIERASLIFVVPAILTLAFPVLFSKPKDFLIPEGIECLYCRGYSVKYNSAFPFSDRRSMGDEIRRHLKIMYHLPGIWLRGFGRCCFGMWQKSRLFRVSCDERSRLSLAVRVVLSLIGITCGILILVPLSAALFVFSFCILSGYLYSPFYTLAVFSGQKVFGYTRATCSKKWILFAFAKRLLFLFCLPAILLVSSNSFYFITSALGYIILGLTLNISIVTPFLVFFLALISNLYLCYENRKNKYKDVKKIISERREKLQLLIRNAPEGTISAKLYWFVCERVLPHEYEFLRMLCNMVFVSVYLLLALSSIVFFGSKYDISTLTLIISVLFTGSIPSLFLKPLTTNTNVNGWAKVKMVREIDQAMKEFLRQ